MPILARPRHDLCFIHVLEGETDPGPRQQCDASIFEHLLDNGIEPEMIAVNAAGCFFVIDEAKLQSVRESLASLNVAIFVRRGCARVALHGSDVQAVPTMSTLLFALNREHITVVHFALEPNGIAALILEDDAVRAAGVFSRFCRPRAA